MLTRTRICIGKDQGREVGGRRKQFARANGYGTMRRERATFSPFLLFSLSLSLSSTFFERVEKILGTNEPRARASMPVNPRSPSILPGSQVFSNLGKTMNDLACASLQPLSFNLSFDFSSLSTLFTRLTEIYGGIRPISLSLSAVAYFSRICIDYDQCHACVSARISRR